MRNTGKQRKKRSREKDIIIPRRILSAIMALVLCVGLYPAWAFAEESVSGPCTHHTEHINMAGTEVLVEVTVTSNPLMEEMVKLSETAVVYDGYEHRPVITVDGLSEGTDYEITYSSQDFTNAGTVAITVTGKGIYTGTVEKTFTIEKAALTVYGTCIATGTYGAKLSALTVGGDWTVRSESGAGVPGRWTLTGDTIPNVGDSRECTATFVPVSDAENYYPLTAQVKLDIKPADQAAPAAPTATEENIKDTSITLTAMKNAEYSLDGTNWQDSPVFAGLSPNTPYTFYVRLKGDKNHNTSPGSTASITTRKTILKTPVISPAEGSYTGSVNVTITCASPGAEIYYTTDGSAPGRGSAHYTGTFAVTVPATIKAISLKEEFTDSAVATASYTEKSSGGSGSGGNGGGNGNNGGKGSGGGDSTNPGNGNNTTPQISVIPPVENIDPGNGAAPGTGTTQANPGNGNTTEQGAGQKNGTGASVQGTRQPFIKGADGKIGWDVIRAEEEKAQEGSTINVDMNGSVAVPRDIFDRIKGKNITITFDMGGGILWSVDGKSVTGDTYPDSAGDIDFSVKTGVGTVPVDIVNNVTGERYSIQISLAFEGEFGFTAVLSIDLGRENAGYTASLYYYNENTGELEFICADEVAADGTVSLAFTHASDYVIAIDGDGGEGDGAAESAQPSGKDGIAGNGTATGENPQEGQPWRPWWIVVIGMLVIVVGVCVFYIAQKKKDEENE